jgi:hypothetical protein
MTHFGEEQAAFRDDAFEDGTNAAPNDAAGK